MKLIKRNIEIWLDIPHTNRLLFTMSNAIIPLLVGGIIYILFVPTSHISEKFYHLLGISAAFNGINRTRNYITCYLTDFLWAYALSSMVMFLEVEQYKDVRKSLIICAVFETTIEILQKTPLIDGTFDICDIGIELFGNICALLVITMYCTLYSRK